MGKYMAATGRRWTRANASRAVIRVRLAVRKVQPPPIHASKAEQARRMTPVSLVPACARCWCLYHIEDTDARCCGVDREPHRQFRFRFETTAAHSKALSPVNCE